MKPIGIMGGLVLVLCALACGDDTSAGTGGQGGSNATSTSGAGAGTTATGGDVGSGGEGGSSGDGGAGGQGGADAGPDVCPAETLCWVAGSGEGDECSPSGSAFLDEPLPAEEVAGARCLLTALRDREAGAVRVGWFNNLFASCAGSQTISFAGERAHVLEDFNNDLIVNESSFAATLLPADVYQACLDLPDDRLHECIGGELFTVAEGCPGGCTCTED